MARPSSKPRVPELDPDAVALAFTGEVLAHYQAGVHELLAPACALTVPAKRKKEEYLRDTALFRIVRRVAAFAIRGEALEGSVSELLLPLEQLAAGPLWGRAGLLGIAANVDPDNETSAIALIISAAIAREQLASAKHPLTSSQLAILSGMTRRHLGQLIRNGELEAEQRGRQGTHGGALIKPAVARKWLRSRGVTIT